MMKNLATLAALLLTILSYAQEMKISQADLLFEQGNFAEAYNLYQESAELYKGSEIYDLYAVCNLKMAQCHLETNAYQQVIEQCENILQYSQEVLPDATGIQVSTLLLEAEAMLKLGQYEPMIDILLKAEQTLQDQQSLLAAECFNDLGVAYWNSNNTETATTYLEKSLKIRENNLKSSDPLLADSYMNLGLVALSDNYQNAKQYFNKALEIYREKFGENHPKVALCLSNLAFANREQGNYLTALDLLDQTLVIWNTNYPGDHPNKALTISNTGRIKQLQGELNEALLLQKQALQMYLRLYGEKHPEVANTHLLIGSVQMKLEEFKNAAESFQKSVYANLLDQNPEDYLSLPELENYFSADILLSSLQYKAQALDALHFQLSLKPKDVKGALATYQKCDDLIISIRQNRLSETDKLRIGEIASEVYENGIRIALYLSEKTLQKEKYKLVAFNFSERSKSAVLQEAISDTKAKSFAGIPDRLLLYEDSLKNVISGIEQKLAEAPSEEELSVLRDQLFEAKQYKRAFISDLETSYPKYFQLKYNQKDIELWKLQQILQQNGALISYFLGKDMLYTFLVTGKKLEVFSTALNNDLKKSTKALRNGIKYKVNSAVEMSAIKLHDQLIPKLPSEIKNLIIIPDGILGTIPFEVLINNENETKQYLVEKYAISYDYAISLLLDKSQNTISRSSGILLVAPVNFEDNQVYMASLPGTEEEVREVKFLFNNTLDEPKTLLKSEASEAAIKSPALSNYRYLHFATHGIVDEAKPELSCIFVSPNSYEDGSLYSGEIYNLKLNADLVTLSACETGLGKVEKGEGIIGLSRALMYAGAKNLIVSLWQVSDASTAEMMIEFYNHHLLHSDDHHFNSSIRAAKLKLINSDNYSAPYYWAAFVLIGR
jgi:CHAT domain-containing protein